MPNKPNSLTDYLWQHWLAPAWLDGMAPAESIVDPCLLTSLTLALDLSRCQELSIEQELDFLGWISGLAQAESLKPRRAVFWLHLQACWLGRILNRIDDRDYLDWLMHHPLSDQSESLTKPMLLLWACPPVFRAAADNWPGKDLPDWLPGTDLNPAALSSCYARIIDTLFPYRQQVCDSFDAVWLVHLMAWLQPLCQSKNWKLRMQATPLLVNVLRRTNQAEGWLRLLGASLETDGFLAKARDLPWSEGYPALAVWLDGLRELEDLQMIRDELFRELNGPRTRPEAKIIRKLIDRLGNPKKQRTTHLISLHAFVRTPEVRPERLSYLPVQSIWSEPDARQTGQIRPGRQDLPYLMSSEGEWYQAWQIGRKLTATPAYRLRQCWEDTLTTYADLTDSLSPDVFRRMRAQQVFEIICLPHADFYFAWILLVLLRLKDRADAQAFFTTGLAAPLLIPGFCGIGPQSWAELIHQCGLTPELSRRDEILDSLHRLSCHQRLSLSAGAMPGWHLLGEFASLICQQLAQGDDLLVGLENLAHVLISQKLTKPDGYWEQTPGLKRPKGLPHPNQLTWESFLQLNPFPLLLAELHQHLEQPGTGTFFFVPLSQEQLALAENESGLIPGAFLVGNLKSLVPAPAWPFVNTRYKDLIAGIAELNRMYLDTVFIAQRATDQERLHQLESEQRELAADHARVIHMQGIDEDLRTLMDGIRQIRHQAVQLQNRVFPGTYGVLSLREDLDWLFAHDRNYEFQLTLDLDSPSLSSVSALEQARDLFSMHERYREDAQVTAIRHVGVQPERRGRPAKGYLFKTMHSDSSTNFAQAWQDYLPILFSQALYLKLPLLRQIVLSSRALDGPLAPADIPHEQQLFRLLKCLIHRSHSPMRHGKGPERRNLLNLAQLLGVLLDAWSWDEHYGLQIEYSEPQTQPIRLTSIQDLLKICTDIHVDGNQTQKALSQRQAILLGVDLRPIDLLTPLHQLISHELRPGADPEACYLTRVRLVNEPGSWTLRLICREHLPTEALRSEEGQHSGLSSCIASLAKALNTTLPTITEHLPEQVITGPLWINCYLQTTRRPGGKRIITEQAAFTEIGLKLKTGELLG